MKGLLQRLVVLLVHRRGGSGSVALGGFLDALVQTFENCRPGLSDQEVSHGGPDVERFFVELYEKEQPRLLAALHTQAPYLDDARKRVFLAEVDTLVRRVVIPGYVRLALRYTPRERNNFFALQESMHSFERAAWVVGSMAMGALAIALPFIPIWAKEWILVFGVVGAFFPVLRRFFAIRGYEARLNELVRHADIELARIDLAYLTAGRASIRSQDTPVEPEDSAEPEKLNPLVNKGKHREGY